METEPDRTRLPEDPDVLVRLDAGSPLPELTATLDEACEQAAKQGERVVVLLRPAPPPLQPRPWPGGVSIREVKRWERAVRRLEQLDSVAIAEGACGGPALDLLLAAGYRICTRDLRLLLPVNEGQFWPGMSLYRLVRRVGPAGARRIVLGDTAIGLPAATELGIVDRVSDDLAEAVRDAAVSRDRLSDREARIRLRLLEEAACADYDDAFGVHLAACDRELRRLAGGGPDRADRTEAAG
ncbi:enoyl-CoA-hydratase DpgB [Streptomyces tremellae]|uniref:Enoyl-CoA hydratase n=1 Tax=Streptomyces tremellae TaxID=1124239 RepID=A0ABP7EBP1_9ACTN